MNKKVFLFSIPMLLMPYIALFCLTAVFLSTKIEFFRFVLESIFLSNGLLLIGALIVYCLLTAVISIICFSMSISKSWDPLSLARTAMIVKILQIPSYIIIFILCILLSLVVLTIPVVIGLIIFDYFTLLLSGLLVGAAAINSTRQGMCKRDNVVWIIVLQFVFCIDVVAAIILYLQLKIQSKNKNQLK